MSKFKLKNQPKQPGAVSHSPSQVKIVDKIDFSADDESWGGQKEQDSGSDFIALDDDEFGKF